MGLPAPGVVGAQDALHRPGVALADGRVSAAVPARPTAPATARVHCGHERHGELGGVAHAPAAIASSMVFAAPAVAIPTRIAQLAGASATALAPVPTMPPRVPAEGLPIVLYAIPVVVPLGRVLARPQALEDPVDLVGLDPVAVVLTTA